MRRFLIFGLSLIFTLTASATPAPVSAQKQFISLVQKTNLDKKDVQFSEFAKELRKQLPPDEAANLDLLVQRVPDFLMPKMQIHKIKNDKGGESYQIQVVSDGHSATLDMQDEEDGALNFKVSSTVNKAPKTWRFSTKDGTQGLIEKMTAFAGENGMELNSAFRFMAPSELAFLSVKDKRAYFKKVQELLAAIEKVEKAFDGGSQKKTSSIWNLLLNPAYATPAMGSPCTVAGYGTTYGADGCGSDDPNVFKVGDSQIQCNPAVYGKSALPVAKGKGADECNASNPDVFPSDEIQNGQQYESFRQNAIAALGDALNKCNVKEKKKSAGEACAGLQQRIDDLSAECAKYKKTHPGKLDNLECGGAVAPPPVVSDEPGPIVDQPQVIRADDPPIRVKKEKSSSCGLCCAGLALGAAAIAGVIGYFIGKGQAKTNTVYVQGTNTTTTVTVPGPTVFVPKPYTPAIK